MSVPDEIRKGRKIWVCSCEHCGEDTLAELDCGRDELCSVCSRPLDEGWWRQEWIPEITS